MKTDARVRYTKKVIQESFLTLLSDTPVNKITVKSICESAEINRATFYKYYNDPFDLLEKIEAELISSMKEFIEDADNEDITQALITILNAIKQNGDLYMALVSDNGDSTFINQIIFDSYQVKKETMTELFKNMPQKEQEWLFQYMTKGFTSVVISWVRNGMKEDPLQVAEFFNKLNTIVINGLRG